MTAAAPGPGFLAGVKVLDRGHGMPAALLSFLLRQMGARVLREMPLADDPFVDVYPAYRTWREGDERPDTPLADLMAEVDVCIFWRGGLPRCAAHDRCFD